VPGKQELRIAGGSFGFCTQIQTHIGESMVLRLYSIAPTVLDWHTKVRREANRRVPSIFDWLLRDMPTYFPASSKLIQTGSDVCNNGFQQRLGIPGFSNFGIVGSLKCPG